MLRIPIVFAAAALLAAPAVAVAKEKPAKPERRDKRAITYVLVGSLSAYQAAGEAANGSITITVAKSNRHGRSLRGEALTFALTTKTKVRIDADGTITDGERGIVKVRGPRRLDAAGLQALPARQVIDKDN